MGLQIGGDAERRGAKRAMDLAQNLSDQISYPLSVQKKKKSYPLERFVVHIVHICRFFFNYIMIFSVLIYRIFSLALKNHIKVCGLAQKIVGP